MAKVSELNEICSCKQISLPNTVLQRRGKGDKSLLVCWHLGKMFTRTNVFARVCSLICYNHSCEHNSKENPLTRFFDVVSLTLFIAKCECK